MKATRTVFDAVRAGEWWEYKIVSILAWFYATHVMLGASIADSWLDGLVLLGALIPGAAFASLVNDWTDIAADARADKPNRMAARNPVARASLIALTLAGGAIFGWLWRHDSALLATYVAAWLAFVLYSVPPFRLKRRGIAGVAADAAGEQGLPTLVAVLAAFRATGVEADWVWSGVAAAWAFAYGLRMILWHQLGDAERDRAAGLGTLGQNPRRAATLGAFLAFPIECAALGALLWMAGSALPWLFLLVYLALILMRLRFWEMRAVMVVPAPRYLLILHEYYDVFLPLGLLVASAWNHQPDLAVLAVHLLLFHRRPLNTAGDMRDFGYGVGRRTGKLIQNR